jgi:hypothetical protein
MSFRCVQWANDCEEVETTAEYAVLINLAQYANEDALAWPSRATLAKNCRMKSLKTVDRHLAGLVAKGLITKMIRKGDDGLHLSSVYRLNLTAVPAKKPRLSKSLEGGGRSKFTPPSFVIQPELELDGGVGQNLTGGSVTSDPTGSVIAVTPNNHSENQGTSPPTPKGAECVGDPPSVEEKGSGNVESRWRDLQREFGVQPIETRASTKAVFRKLSVADQERAIAAAAEYRRACDRAKRKPVFLFAYLAERVFDGFVVGDTKHGPPAGPRVFVRAETPEWDAWQRVRSTARTYSPEHGGDGWWFPAPAPPGYVPPATRRQREAAA